jgi:hypothetical protein
MGRQPCCDKVGLKKGPWTAEEDQKLVSFILGNRQCCWRAVPKLAGAYLSIYVRACSIDRRSFCHDERSLSRVAMPCRAAAVREELPAALDQLPAAGPQEGPALRRRGEARHRPACSARQQVPCMHCIPPLLKMNCVLYLS